MKKKLRYLLPLLLVALFSLTARAGYPAFRNETLKYTISYKWGLIQKDAGKATLRFVNKPDSYEIVLSAGTLPWADKIFCVRDTLVSWINRQDFRPTKYVKTTHENGRYNQDVLIYSYNGNNVTGTCHRTKIVDGKTRKSVYKATVSGKTFDMISIFYYIRSLDFASISGGKSIKANILSGSSPEIITIRNLGIENATMPSGKIYRCYHIQFTFTTDGGKSVSNPMDTWITVSDQHIPVKLVGTLPIGKVRAFLDSVTYN